MRIGYVLKKYPRLSETFILREILGLENASVDVRIFSLRHPDETRYHSDLGLVRGEVEYLPQFGSAATFEAFRTLSQIADKPKIEKAFRFLDLIQQEKQTDVLIESIHLARRALDSELDHLHAHFMTVAAHVTHLASIFSGIPFSVTAHAKDIYRNTVDPSLFQEIAHAASSIRTVCDANVAYIKEHLTDGEGRIRRVYNGIDLDRLPTSGPRRSKLVLAVGRLVEKKGFHVLVRSCSLLKRRGVAFNCVIVGEGEERPHLQAMVEAHDLEDTVSLRGSLTRDKVLELMMQARVLAAPCLVGGDGNRDALPTVLIEALAVGLPVVTTDVGGITEIVDDGVHGRVVAEKDGHALADALADLLSNEAAWTAMSSTGPARVKERFDLKETTTDLAETFFRRLPEALSAGSAR